MNDTLLIKRVLPLCDYLFTCDSPRKFVTLFIASAASFDVVISDVVREYIPLRRTVKGWSRRFFSRPLPQHFDRQEVDLFRRCTRRLGRRTPLRAAASEPALLPVERPRALVDRVPQAQGDQREDDEMLKPKGHGSTEQLGQGNGHPRSGQQLNRVRRLEQLERRIPKAQFRALVRDGVAVQLDPTVSHVD
jgi:hypothetical protein